MLKRFTIAGLALMTIDLSAKAADNRVWLAQQLDGAGKTGFSLSLENTGPAEPLHLSTARIVLAVGDGKALRYIESTPKWELDRDYTVKAVIAPDSASVFLDETLVAEGKGPFVPASASLNAFRIPDWASGPVDYFVIARSLTRSSAGGKPVTVKWPEPNADSKVLRLFEPQTPLRTAWSTRPGDTLTVIARFRFAARPEVRSLAPFVDRYGQAIHADFPGKVKDDGELKASIADELKHMKSWAPDPNRDKFGGEKTAGWNEKATGYYGVAKRDGFWWMTSPEGNPLFYVGLCTVDRTSWERTPVTGREFLFKELPPKTGPYADAWAMNPWGGDDHVDFASFYTANLVRKYGADWLSRTEPSIDDRLAKWGFDGAGKWGDRAGTTTPHISVIYRGDTPNLAQHPDVFDAAVRAAFKENLRREVEPRKTDPWLVGWSVGNEFDEIIHRDEIPVILGKTAATPGKRALIDAVVDKQYSGDAAAAGKAWGITASSRDDLYTATPKPNDDDLEAMRRFYADRYYAFIHETIKSLDLNHLYFGFWIVPWWWENESDWSLIAAHCDVMGFDKYADTFSDPNMDRWLKQADKPVFCGEFSFPPSYEGTRGLGVYTAVSTESDRGAGAKYKDWVRDAATNPYCVGLTYFQYRDQPITGRGPGSGTGLVIGEHYAFGLVDITDRPKWDFVDMVRAANLSAPGIRRASAVGAARATRRTE